MDLDVEQLVTAVLHQSAADRASLAARLLASLDEDAAERAAYDAAWEAELDRREAAAAADPDGDVPADVVLADLRAELAAAPGAAA